MITLPIRYSQLDDRWSTILLGYNTDPKYNIYNYGCLLSCLAMVLEYYGIDTDPARLNQTFKDNNSFQAQTGIYDWGSLSKIDPSVSDSVVKTPSKLTDAQMGEIKTALDANKPVVCQIDYNPKIVEPTMHFVVLVGYNPNDENDFTIVDPLGGTVHSLKDYLGWYHPSARSTIEAYCIVEGSIPQVAQASDGVVVDGSIFPLIVHGSDQWDKTISKYIPSVDPKKTDFENLDKVIGGIKSRATDMETQLKNQAGDVAAAQQSVKSLKEELANEEVQRGHDKEMYLAQITALKSSGGNLDKITQTYEGRISALQGQIKTLLSEKTTLATSNARLSAPSALIDTISFAQKYFPTFSSWIKQLKH